jgi:hypothetical protein
LEPCPILFAAKKNRETYFDLPGLHLHHPMATNDQDAEKLAESSRSSIDKLKALIDELKIVEQHEHNVIADDESPVLRTATDTSGTG